VEKIYSADGKLSWEGEFNNNKRVGLWRFYSKDSIYEINY
jgi:antitoxin component YwqK of YwqJK toxin-antitoxin module